MLDRHIDLGIYRRHAARIADREGRLAGQRVQQDPVHHPTTLLRLPEAAGRALDLSAMEEPTLLQAYGQEHDLGLEAGHPLRQQSKRRGDDVPADLL
ncbi:hypothetical protein D3C84_1129490 [compost metagenome]